MAGRRSTARVPIWVRVPGTIAAVLVAIVLGAMLAGAAGVGGGRGPDKHAPGHGQNGDQPAPSTGHQRPAGEHR